MGAVEQNESSEEGLSPMETTVLLRSKHSQTDNTPTDSDMNNSPTSAGTPYSIG